MKLLLDSSFFFPLIGVVIEGYPKESLQSLLKKEEIMRSELATFELSAKGSKLINEGKLQVEDLTRGITALYYHPTITAIPIHYSEIQQLSCKLRKYHSDYIDCLTAATAVYHADCFLTFDKEIKKKSQEDWKEIIRNENKKFSVMLWQEYKKQLK